MKEGQKDAARGRANQNISVAGPLPWTVRSGANATAQSVSWPSRWRALACLGLLGLAATGCQTVQPFPPANLQAPGWTVRQGQAVWQRPHGAAEVAGEIVLATRPEGRSFVQFSKNGFPLLTAQTEGKKWEADVPTQNKRYAGHGNPPQRLFLLYLARALEGKPLPKGWTWTHRSDGGWHLENPATGESLDGYFSS